MVCDPSQYLLVTIAQIPYLQCFQKTRLNRPFFLATVAALLNARQVDHLTEKLERSLANTERLLEQLANSSGAHGEGGGAAAGSPTANFRTEEPTPATNTGGATQAPVDIGSTSHPTGWFYGQLPAFGTCGGKRGSLSQIWQVWGGVGPGKVVGGEKGFNLRAHGETTVKEQKAWGSTSNYGRYLQAGRYMDAKIAAIKVMSCCRHVVVIVVIFLCLVF